ncbi:MAG: ribosome maturation factor RimP [Candidatus Krumholzibacteria bacterium]|nr:ribosome maturation factor RimP [Candidatus Krumholzibacteria bacterium]
MESNELEKIVAPELELLGFECVKLEIVGTNRSPIVRLYIDRAEGVSIKDCAMISRTVGLLFDRIDPFPGRYLLEVSSPGSSRPLTRAEHFIRFTGCQARVQSASPEAGKKTYTGNIRSCINGLLVMDTDTGQQLIRLSDVVKANLINREYQIDKKQKQSKRNKGE